MQINIHTEILSALSNQKIKYLIAGAWNTLFGYSCGVTIYYLFGDLLGVLIVAILSNILAISMSFLTHKLFVFKTKGNWLREYLRAYCVYGVSASVGILILLIFVKLLNIQFWLAQGLVILLTVIISYIGHKKFTFRN
jgi:putative flippase GtrA